MEKFKSEMLNTYLKGYELIKKTEHVSYALYKYVNHSCEWCNEDVLDLELKVPSNQWELYFNGLSVTGLTPLQDFYVKGKGYDKHLICAKCYNKLNNWMIEEEIKENNISPMTFVSLLGNTGLDYEQDATLSYYEGFKPIHRHLKYTNNKDLATKLYYWLLNSGEEGEEGE